MLSKASIGYFGIDHSVELIQMIRLVEAILESDFDVHLPESSASTFEYLSKNFQLDYQIGLEGIPLLKDISISHKQPLCSIGTINRPLIFSHQLVNKCREKWSKDRSIKFIFCGLMTKKRKKILEDWVLSCFKRKISLISQTESRNLLKLIFYYLKNSVHQNQAILKEIGVYIFASKKGRILPYKAWDEDYYNMLSKSRFVLCPNGDHVWTYRFFESILCGAIPVVEGNFPISPGRQQVIP